LQTEFFYIEAAGGLERDAGALRGVKQRSAAANVTCFVCTYCFTDLNPESNRKRR